MELEYRDNILHFCSVSWGLCVANFQLGNVNRICVYVCVCMIRRGGKSTARKLRKTPKNATPTTKRPPQTDEWKENRNSRCCSSSGSSCSCRKEQKQKQHKRTNKWTNLALLIGICITIFHLQFDRLSADRVWQGRRPCTPALIVCVCVCGVRWPLAALVKHNLI